MYDAPTPLKLSIRSPANVWIEQANGGIEIHPLWLRERCQDSKSLDGLTGQRLYDPSDFDLDLKLESVTEATPGRLQVRFSDGHQAEFSIPDILSEATLAADETGCPALELWTASLPNLPRARWRADPTNAQLTDWLERFLRYGFIILSDVTPDPRQVLKVAAQFGFTRETNFGTLFEVRSTPDASDLAYTPIPLDPHTDNPYRQPVPGVQLLHCLKNETSGGLSTLVDGFAVADALKSQDPLAYRILSSIAVRFRYRDKHTELTASAPPIELDVNGAVRTIHFSPRLDFVPLLPRAELTAYYRARRVFNRMLRAPEFEIRFLLNSGELVMFDNCRLLHGRTGFDPAQGLRHLQGCYIDIDGPRSLYRVLRRKELLCKT